MNDQTMEDYRRLQKIIEGERLRKILYQKLNLVNQNIEQLS